MLRRGDLIAVLNFSILWVVLALLIFFLSYFFHRISRLKTFYSDFECRPCYSVWSLFLGKFLLPLSNSVVAPRLSGLIQDYRNEFD